MKAETVLHARLTTHAGVTDIASTRVYTPVLPQAPTYPCIVLKRIASRRVTGVHEPAGYAYATIQVICYAATYEAVKNLAEQVRLALDRYGSAVTGTSIAGVTVYDIVMGSEADDYDPTSDKFAVSIDFEVLHAE